MPYIEEALYDLKSGQTQEVVENALRCVRMTTGAIKFIYRYFLFCPVTSETLHIGKRQNVMASP